MKASLAKNVYAGLNLMESPSPCQRHIVANSEYIDVAC